MLGSTTVSCGPGRPDGTRTRSENVMRAELAVFRRLPRWIPLILGLVCVVAGAVLVVRPFTSLSVLATLVAAALLVTGVMELAAVPVWPPAAITASAGLGWLVAGIVVAAWPGITIVALAIVAGISMIIGGATRIMSALRGTVDQRVASALSGLASVIFGALALSWPDVTVLVIAVVFGARTVLFGLSQIVQVFSDRGTGTGPAAIDDRPRTRLRRWSRALGSTVALVVAMALLAASSVIHRSVTPPGTFYTPPSTVPARPGVLLRSEPFTRDVPANARGWLILYTTTRDFGVPAVASAIVVAPAHPPAGPRPVIAWTHGTTGVAEECAPSLLPHPFTAGALFVLPQILAQGWVLVATDYTGMGTEGPSPFLIGQGEARSNLDAVRAAHQLTQLDLADQTVLWGHSQGGHAALWAGILAPTYAPDDHVAGVAALAPASDLTRMVDDLARVPGGSIFSAYAITAYSQAYHDVRFGRYVRPPAQTISRRTASRCLSGPGALVSVAQSLVLGKTIFTTNPATGTLGQRLIQNTPERDIQAPVLIAQGLTDRLVLPSVQDHYARQRCDAGQKLDYLTYPGRGHVDLVTAGSPFIPALISWTKDRLTGKPAPDNCATL
jgi:uncharacterized membrane protein HdeD (DUF308 family)/pimeloyl-ACP methyl ester carboxylesterase